MRFPEFTGEWKRTTINNECKINPTTPPLPNLFVYVDLEAVVKGELIKREVIEKHIAPSRAQRVLRDGDILFQCVRPYQLNNYLYLKQDEQNWVASTGYAQLRTEHIGRFIYQYLYSPRLNKDVMLRCTGTSYPAISSSDLGKIDIYICEIEEQQKIASLLSLIDERISTQNKIIKELESSIKGLRELLVKHNNEWCKIKLSECCVIKSGLSLPQNDFLKGYPVTRIETISQRKINLNKTGYVLTNTDISSYKLHYGDILFSNINSVSHIGKTAFVDEDYDLYHGMNLLRIISNESIITPYFLYLILNTNRAVNSFQSTCNQAVSQASINQTELSKFTISIPSIAKQNTAVALMKLMNNWIYTEMKILESYNKQKEYCLKNLFI